MSFYLESGRLTIDGDGSVSFDTDQPIFHTISVVSGAVAIPAVSASGSNIDSTTSYTLGTCNTSCTHAVGALKFTLNNYAAGMAFDRWHTIFGGSVLWLIDGESGLSSQFGRNYLPSQFCVYSIRVEAGVVYLDRRLFIDAPPSPNVYGIFSHTIEYRLEAGLFS